MTLAYFNDISVYFHMRNHYRTLKNAKSVVDTSLPQSLLKSPMALTNLDKSTKGATNEQLRKIYSTNTQTFIPKRRGPIKKHNCLSAEAKSEASLISTENHQTYSHRQLQAPSSRPLSIEPTSKSEKMFRLKPRRRQSVDNHKSNTIEGRELQLDLSVPHQGAVRSNTAPCSSKRSSQSSRNDSSRIQSPQGQEDSNKMIEHNSQLMMCSTEGSREDQEYLLFLLRITEDIISNDYYSNTDIKRIFQTHVNLNKHRLDVDKMNTHLANLSKELNVDFDAVQLHCDSVLSSDRSNSKPSNSPNGYALSNEAFKNCLDCSAIRKSSVHQSLVLNQQVNYNEELLLAEKLSETLMNGITGEGSSSCIRPSLLRLLDKLSLGRVTERTEPIASTSTVMSTGITLANNTITDSRDDIHAETGEEQVPKDFDTFYQELNSTNAIIPECPASSSEDTVINLANLPAEVSLLPIIQSNDAELKISSPRTASNLKSSTESDVITDTNTQPTKNDFLNNENVQKSNDDCDKQTVELNIDTKNQQNEKEQQMFTELNLAKTIEEIVEQKSTDNNKDQENSDLINCLLPSSPLKLFLEEPIKDEDYIMVKGPVYVYKALLDCDPKLVIISQPEPPPSPSNHSHQTFTVENQTELHEIDQVPSHVENILELTRTCYDQFMDAKLLRSDYDLTPERDESDNKYHHLMVDATSSVSGLNLTETLLLNDDYLVNLEDQESEKALKVTSSHSIDDPKYVKMNFKTKMYENDYVLHRRLFPNISVPKFTFNSKYEDVTIDDGNNRQCSDGVSFGSPSQDSSLRSEGEAVLISERPNCSEFSLSRS